MNLLIAGDSFARPGKTPDFFGWSDILSQQYNYNITNIAASGTSLHWTYKRLMSYQSNFNNFDKIIVFVTQCGRSTINVTYDMDNLLELAKYRAPHSKDIGNLLRRFPNEDKLYYEELEAVKLYDLHLKHTNFEFFFYKKLIKKIFEIVPRNKLILIQSYPCPEDLVHLFSASFSMTQICLEEVASVHKTSLHGLHKVYNEQVHTTHMNHMTPENREIFASYINRLIKNPADNFFNLAQIVKIPRDKLELYYKPKGQT